MIYPWLAPCGSSPDYLHVCYFTETAQGNVRIRLCVTIIFKYFCVCGKGQILKISLQLGLLSTLKKKTPSHPSLLYPASDTPRSFHKFQIYTFKN